MLFPLSIEVKDSSQTGEARRLATTLCSKLGFVESRIGQVALIVTELATNLVKHTAGTGGVVILSPIEELGATGLDILSLDKGPGLSNAHIFLSDPPPSDSSLGVGLGAVRRQADTFDCFSTPGHGSAVFCRLWKEAPPITPPPLTVGAVCLPVIGEQSCGDAWAMNPGHNSTLFLLADGLGHGPNAALASNLAIGIFQNQPECDPEKLVRLIHGGLKTTRGAALAVVDVAEELGRILFVGVGNISGLILSENTKQHMVSHNGTAGMEPLQIKEFTYPWPEDGLLVLHSDGIATHWSLGDYPGLAWKHPALIAGVLFRDFHRVRDDSTVIVARGSKRRLKE